MLSVHGVTARCIEAHGAVHMLPNIGCCVEGHDAEVHGIPVRGFCLVLNVLIVVLLLDVLLFNTSSLTPARVSSLAHYGVCY